MRIQYELWLYFQQIGTMFQMLMIPAGGAGVGAVGSPVPIASSLPELAQKLSRYGWPAGVVEDILKQIKEKGAAQVGPIRVSDEQCAVFGLHPQPSQLVLDIADVETWIGQLESCPPGALGDDLSKDIHFVVNNCKQTGRWSDVCKRGQVVLVDYQQRKAK